MVTPTRKRKYEEVCWSLSCFSLAVHCAGVSAFCFPIAGILGLIAITTTHCTYHYHMHTQVLVLHGLIWRASVGTCNQEFLINSWCNVSVSREWETDTDGRLVDAHVPVDHASVGLA